MNDEQTLIEQAKHNPEAFSALYDVYFPRVYAYIAYRVGRKTDAEDLTADVFMRVVRALKGFEYRTDNAFAAWVFSIAHNAVVQFYRRLPPPALSLDDVPHIQGSAHSPESLYADQERFKHLHAMIKTLAPRRQEIVTLRYFAGLKNREIAQVLGLDERTVASHLSRALDDLQRGYERELGADYEIER
ncbi:MAG: sigma-70 family RNA polymerase sigma factor [Armatimonadetes bacterium]|nr:sigma-70 family RNA polymerase sigma factor [Anaerolineae bacterium]